MELLRYLAVIFAVMFWGFRVTVAVTTSLNVDIGISPADLTTEIIVLFITLACLVFIVRGKAIAAIIYTITYVWYFGKDVVNAVVQVNQGGTIATAQALDIFISFVAIVIAFITLVATLLSNVKTGTKQDKKTDWFYKNKDFDRQYDERADRNNYKF